MGWEKSVCFLKFDFLTIPFGKIDFGKVNIAVLNSKKLKEIGWTCNYKIIDGLAETIEIIRHLL